MIQLHRDDRFLECDGLLVLIDNFCRSAGVLTPEHEDKVSSVQRGLELGAPRFSWSQGVLVLEDPVRRRGAKEAHHWAYKGSVAAAVGNEDRLAHSMPTIPREQLSRGGLLVPESVVLDGIALFSKSCCK